MKTTVDLPVELYRKVKMKAASENRKIRDLVSEGLELLMKSTNAEIDSVKRTLDHEEVLGGMEKIRQCQPALPRSIQSLIDESNRQRRSGCL